MEFNQSVFFRAIVKQLHDDGTLQSYAQPKGTAHDHWGDWSKDAHGSQKPAFLQRFIPALRKDRPGLVRHIGDEPYSFLTTGQLQYYREVEPGQKDIDLKVASIREAINRYMPPDAFADYLAYFQQTLDTPSHRAAIENSFRKLEEQAFEYRADTGTIDMNKKGSELRGALAKAPISTQLTQYPTLTLSLLIYHAAHASYLEQMKAAVDSSFGSGIINRTEHDNAMYTLKSNSFRQFSGFLLFATVAPLTLNAYQNADADSPSPQVAQSGIEHHGSHPLAVTPLIDAADHARMKAAIGTAWKTFMRKAVLLREYRPGDALPPQENQQTEKRMLCPAHMHLQASAKDALIERTYDFILNNPEKVKDSLGRLQQKLSELQR